MLEEIFTPVERTLIAAGKADRVTETRAAYQEAVQADLIAVVEEALSREVRALVSQVHVGADIAVELFVLADAETEAGRDGGGDE